MSTKMKEMVYGIDNSCLLHQEWVGDYQIAVVNIHGSHPCGYIRIPDQMLNDLLKNNGMSAINNENDWEASVHYGLTYCDYGDRGYPDELKYGLWIGWDYAHLGDYCGFDVSDRSGKKWTTEEIVQEAKNALETIKFYPEF